MKLQAMIVLLKLTAFSSVNHGNELACTLVVEGKGGFVAAQVLGLLEEIDHE